MIGFGLASDWLRRWREIFKPITERSKAKPISDYFRYSIENRSNQVNADITAKLQPDTRLTSEILAKFKKNLYARVANEC